MITHPTTAPWTIRPATDADGDALAALIEAIWLEYPGVVFDRAAELPELDAPATHYAGIGGALWVLEGADGSIAGSVATAPRIAEPGGWELFKLYLAADLRGSGVARALLDLAESHAATAGATHMTLWTDTRFQAAHRFYSRQGYVQGPGTRALHDLSDTIEYPFCKRLKDAARRHERVA